MLVKHTYIYKKSAHMHIHCNGIVIECVMTIHNHREWYPSPVLIIVLNHSNHSRLAGHSNGQLSMQLHSPASDVQEKRGHHNVESQFLEGDGLSPGNGQAVICAAVQSERVAKGRSPTFSYSHKSGNEGCWKESNRRLTSGGCKINLHKLLPLAQKKPLSKILI